MYISTTNTFTNFIFRVIHCNLLYLVFAESNGDGLRRKIHNVARPVGCYKDKTEDRALPRLMWTGRDSQSNVYNGKKLTGKSTNSSYGSSLTNVLRKQTV